MKDFDITKGYWEQERKDTQLYKAFNILHLQKGSSVFNSESGIDFEYFFNPDISFQKEAFCGYVIQELIQQNINVMNNDIQKQTFKIVNKIEINSNQQNGGGLYK